MRHLLNVIEAVWKNPWVSGLNWFLVGMGAASLARTVASFISGFRAGKLELKLPPGRSDPAFVLFLLSGQNLAQWAHVESLAQAGRAHAEETYRRAGRLAAEDCAPEPEFPYEH